MLSRLCIFILCACFCNSIFAAEKNVNNIPTKIPNAVLQALQPPKEMINRSSTLGLKKITRVIYITLDGVRWQDIFEDRSHLKTFWAKYADGMVKYGDPKTMVRMEVASVPISLPSYQSQMSGAVQPCQDNHCGRIKVTTMPEYLIKQFGFKKKEIAIFASWYAISFAAEHVIGNVFNNSGNQFVYDPDTGFADPIMFFLNEQQSKFNADLIDRFDIFTFAHAMHYLEVYQPHFLWLALTDADIAAHLKQRKLYHTILELYDRMLDVLLTTLDTLNLSDETLIIITTDHGRGNGEHWSDHGPEYPESKQTWAFVRNGVLSEISPNYHNTLSIRPTIENVFKSMQRSA